MEFRLGTLFFTFSDEEIQALEERVRQCRIRCIAEGDGAKNFSFKPPVPCVKGQAIPAILEGMDGANDYALNLPRSVKQPNTYQ